MSLSSSVSELYTWFTPLDVLVELLAAAIPFRITIDPPVGAVTNCVFITDRTGRLLLLVLIPPAAGLSVVRRSRCMSNWSTWYWDIPYCRARHGSGAAIAAFVSMLTRINADFLLEAAAMANAVVRLMLVHISCLLPRRAAAIGGRRRLRSLSTIDKFQLYCRHYSWCRHQRQVLVFCGHRAKRLRRAWETCGWAYSIPRVHRRVGRAWKKSWVPPSWKNEKRNKYAPGYRLHHGRKIWVGHVIFCQGRIKAQFTNSNKQESNWVLVELFRACAVRWRFWGGIHPKIGLGWIPPQLYFKRYLNSTQKTDLRTALHKS